MPLYSFGSNGKGQLGLGHTEDTESPGLVIFKPEYTCLISAASSPAAYFEIACGGNHTLLLDKSSGKVFGTGDNSAFQLGLLAQGSAGGGGTSVLEFTELELPVGAPKVTHVAAGWEFSVAVCGQDGAVYTCGRGPKGELANGNDAVKTHRKFLKVFQFDTAEKGQTVVQVAAGLAHVALVLANGQVWGWGTGRKGQLGPRNTAAAVTRPSVVEYEGAGNAVAVACGRAFTAILTGAGSVLILGSDKNLDSGSAVAKLGELNSASSNVGGAVRSIAAGWSTVHVLLSSPQTLVSIGNNSHGQLGPLAKSSKEVDTNANSSTANFSMHAAGTEHSLAVTQDLTTVVSWGWGEHGNCGPLYSESRPKGEVYEAHRCTGSSKVERVFGGYASSWIIESPS